MDSHLAMLEERIHAAAQSSREFETIHIRLMQERSEQEVRLWQEMYKLNTEAYERGMDLINAQSAAHTATELAMQDAGPSHAEKTHLHGRMNIISARRAGIAVEKRIEDTGRLLMSRVSQAAAIQVGKDAQACHEHMQVMQIELSAILTKQADDTIAQVRELMADYAHAGVVRFQITKM